MNKIKCIEFILLFISSIAIYIVSAGIDFSDSMSILKWMMERDIQGYNYLSFLDFYAFFKEYFTEKFIFKNLILLLFINLLIVNIGISSLLLYFYLTAFSCLLGLITKELFFLLGFLLLIATKFYAGKKIILLLIGYGCGSYILLITKPLLGGIYIASLIYVSLGNRLKINSNIIFYGILIIICIIFINTKIYNNMESIYFGQNFSEDFNRYLGGHSSIAMLGRFIANIISPVYNIDSISGLDSYQLYISIAAISIIFRFFYIFFKKCKNYYLLDFHIKFIVVLNIVISVLIPFVQTRYLLPGLIILFLKPEKNNQ